jgi:glycosyltransferase involved in cell wall biosynthesis
LPGRPTAELDQRHFASKVQENWHEGAKHGSNGWVRGVDVTELISIVVTTYNREDALDAVLRSLARQKDAAFEIIVADDGSGPATARLIESWKTKIGRRLEHVWHADCGFRAAEIRNHAILATQGAYCIFLDGDCIVRPDFVASHRRLAEPGWFVTGNRVLLSAELTAKVLQEKLALEYRDKSSVGDPLFAARTVAPNSSGHMERCTIVQSRNLALRPRSHRRV